MLFWGVKGKSNGTLSLFSLQFVVHLAHYCIISLSCDNVIQFDNYTLKGDWGSPLWGSVEVGGFGGEER
jgi:hypothetical protein